MSKRHELSLGSISELDGGRVDVAFQQALARMVRDCDDRPGESKPRTVALNACITPICDEDGVCRDVDVRFHVKDKAPDRKSKTYAMKLHKGGQLSFSEMTADGSESIFDGE